MPEPSPAWNPAAPCEGAVQAAAATSQRAMPDWKSLVRARIAPMPLDPAREADIVDELAQHVAQHYAELTAAGAARTQRPARALAPLDDPARVAAEIARADRPRPRRRPRRQPAPSRVDLWRRRPLRGALLLRAPGFTAAAACHAGARHRRQHRDLQRAERGPAAAAALRRSRSARPDRRARTGRSRAGNVGYMHRSSTGASAAAASRRWR